MASKCLAGLEAAQRLSSANMPQYTEHAFGVAQGDLALIIVNSHDTLVCRSNNSRIQQQGVSMKAKATTLTVLFVMGAVAFSVTQAQSNTNTNTNTATISRGGGITSQNPSSWISAVRIQSSGSFGAGAVYQVIFSGNAPSASSCTATPTTSDLTGLVTAPAATPGQLLVSFQQSGSSGGQITPVASGFTLSCAASSS
jgi:hypothetical protein